MYEFATDVSILMSLHGLSLKLSLSASIIALSSQMSVSARSVYSRLFRMVQPLLISTTFLALLIHYKTMSCISFYRPKTNGMIAKRLLPDPSGKFLTAGGPAGPGISNSD